MANPPNRGRCSWEAGLGVGPRCLPRGQGEDGADRDRGEIRNLQSEDRQEEVDRGSLEPKGHGAGHLRTVEDERGTTRRPTGRSSRSCRYPRKQSASMMRMSKRRERWPITKKDMEQHGYSAKCPGCASVIRGTTRQAHSAACRMRFGEILKGTENYKRVEEKFDRHVARALERRDEEDRKRRKVEQEKTEAVGTSDARERTDGGDSREEAGKRRG